MYQLTNYTKKQAYKQPTDDQIRQIQSTQEYLKKHKIHQIFNEMLAKLIQTKPDHPKQGLAAILKSMKQRNHFFRKTDFENMYDSYDFFEDIGGNKIPYSYAIQALKRINVEYTKQQFLQKHPKYLLDRGMTKLEFVNLMENQYKQVVQF